MSTATSATASTRRNQSKLSSKRRASRDSVRATPRKATRRAAIERSALTATARADASALASQVARTDGATGTDLSAERLSGQFALGRFGGFLPRDLVGTARTVVRQSRRKPAAALRATAGFAGELLKIAGGEWISSVELENLAIGCPGVANAAAIGVRHPRWDERPLLVVQPKPGVTLDKQSVIAFLEGKVAKWWLPEDVVFVDSIPLTATGKLYKLELRKRFGDHFMR